MMIAWVIEWPLDWIGFIGFWTIIQKPIDPIWMLNFWIQSYPIRLQLQLDFRSWSVSANTSDQFKLNQMDFYTLLNKAIAFLFMLFCLFLSETIFFQNAKKFT